MSSYANVENGKLELPTVLWTGIVKTGEFSGTCRVVAKNPTSKYRIPSTEVDVVVEVETKDAMDNSSWVLTHGSQVSAAAIRVALVELASLLPSNTPEDG